jgi:hypothetical protein
VLSLFRVARGDTLDCDLLFGILSLAQIQGERRGHHKKETRVGDATTSHKKIRWLGEAAGSESVARCLSRNGYWYCINLSICHLSSSWSRSIIIEN